MMIEYWVAHLESLRSTELMDSNHCTYLLIRKKLNIRSADIHKIIPVELHMKKVVCRWVSSNPTEYQKEKHLRIRKETLKLLNDGGHRNISKIVTGDETHIPFLTFQHAKKAKLGL
ncbi:uncharacterized protein TNCV_5047741 [Trichonephila clavipes]|nr:uncharacterized protein TNCV_5047741 [Trichonephila clavipes]